MSNPVRDPGTTLRLRRKIRASRERVFRAWTEPALLRKWFAVAEGYTTPIAEVDLRVGGRYRLGMKPAGDGPVLIVGGMYQEVLIPEKLVFTWRWENSDENEPETLVTVEFIAHGDLTEVALQHERFINVSQRDRHGEGWVGCLDQLERLLDE